MRESGERRQVRRRHVDFVVDREGRARSTSAARLRRSPLLAMALAGMAGVAMTSPELAVGEAMLASGRAAAHGTELLVASARSAVRSAADLIRSRSPGTRTAAQLIKIKHPPAVAARSRPVARAKPRLLVPPAGLPAFLTPPPAAAPLAFADTPLVPGFVPLSALPAGPIEQPPLCNCGFVYVPPWGGGGGGVVFGPGGGGPGSPPPPPPPGVPEPQSWALMILGFGAIGALWRRRRTIVAAIRAIPRLTYAPLG